MKTLIHGALAVATCDDARTVLTGADVLIEDRRIAAVGKDLKEPVDRRIDATGCVVVPGLVNTHHHLYQTLTRNVPGTQNVALFDWLRKLYQVWRGLTPAALRSGTLVGCGELLLTGCTTTTDHHYVFPRRQPADLLDHSIEAAREIGIRFHPTRGSMSLGESKGGLPPDDLVQREDAILSDCVRVIDRYHDPEPLSMCRVALAPCSPFSVTQDLMRQAVALAEDRGVRLHTHLAETKDEEQYCLEAHKMRPVDLMDELGWLSDRAWFAHVVHVNAREAKRMGQRGTGVAHCPTSNMRLASGIAPLGLLRRAGVRVGLGVDGSASNDASDMLGELRSCLLVHRLKEGPAATDAREVLWLATRGGAAALGRDDIGQIAPGKAADLAIFDQRRIAFAGSRSDPVAALVFAGDNHVARTVIVNGRVVVDDHQLETIDEEAVTREAHAVSARLLEGTAARA